MIAYNNARARLCVCMYLSTYLPIYPFTLFCVLDYDYGADFGEREELGGDDRATAAIH